MSYTDNFKTELLPLIDDLIGAENGTFNKLIFKKAFLASDITKDHTVVTGVRNGSAVPIIDPEVNYEAFPFIDANSCDTEECDLNTSYSGVTWKLGLISCRVPICLRTFDDKFLVFWNSYKMLNPAKVDAKYLKTALLTYITNLIVNSLEAAKWRVEYFAEDGHSSDLLNGFDGWFAQAESDPNLVVSIAKNASTKPDPTDPDETIPATYADQKMTGQEIYETLLAMYELYEAQEWAHDKPMEFRITKQMAVTLASYLNSLKDTACCDGVERLNPDTFGLKSFSFDKLAFRGIPLKPMPEWDKIINKVTALNGGGGNAARVNPNRVLLINKSNILIGTEEREDLSMLDIFYEKKDKKVYFDVEAYLGAAIPLREYILAI